MDEKKIKIHNRSKRTFTIPPAPNKTKSREVPAGRAVVLEESMALKLLKAYPKELIKYKDLVDTGEAKENESLKKENEALKAKIAAMEKQNPPVGENDGEAPVKENEQSTEKGNNPGKKEK